MNKLFGQSYLSIWILRWFQGKSSTCQCRRRGLDPWIRKIPWRRKWQTSILAWETLWTEEPGRLQSHLSIYLENSDKCNTNTEYASRAKRCILSHLKPTKITRDYFYNCPQATQYQWYKFYLSQFSKRLLVTATRRNTQ